MSDQPRLPIDATPDGAEPKPARLVPGANPEPVADGWVRCEYGVYWRTDKTPGYLETGTPGDVHRLLDHFRARLHAADEERDALRSVVQERDQTIAHLQEVIATHGRIFAALGGKATEG